MSTYHNKSIYINSGITSLVSNTGFKVNNPVFYYKDQTNITFNVSDNKKLPVNLTGGSFELKIAESYNSTPMIDVTSFNTSLISTGIISCVVDFNQGSILTFLDSVASKLAVGSLWVTISGVRYCLASFICRLNNLVF